MTSLGRMPNHSNNPNADMLQDGKEVWAFSVMDIKSGDEITLDYRTALPCYDRNVSGFNL